MSQKIRKTFLFLVLAQGLHSIEEYIGELWEVFPPARALCSLFSDNLEKGFLIINIGLFVSGILFWTFLVNMNKIIVNILIWFWIIIEIMNGVMHPVWALVERSYTPGVITALMLLIISLYLLSLKIKPIKRKLTK